MADDNFTPLTDEEAADAKSAARVLSTAFLACGYPPEVALNTRLTFNRLSAYNQHYLMKLEVPDRTFEDCMDRRDPAAYTVYCLARALTECHMNIEGAPFTLSIVFSGQIREMTAALTGATIRLAPQLVPKFTNRPWMN